MSILENPGNGGRGRKAPYESTHYRIPLPLKPAIESIAKRYRELIVDYENPENIDLINSAIDGTDNLAAIPDKRKIILDAMARFIESQRQAYKPNGSQKEFSLVTRKWDAFREFQKFVEGQD